MNQGGIFPANSVPFTIEQGTPTDTLVLASVGFGAAVRGHVGIGTASPEIILGNATTGDTRHLNLTAGTGLARAIVQGQTAAETYMVHTGSPANSRILRTRVVNGKYFLSATRDNLTSFNEGYAFTIN